jgi:hypothetical protein
MSKTGAATPDMDSLIELKTDIRQIYAQRHSDGKYERTSEKVLAAQEKRGPNPRKFQKAFKGDCRICGKKGHKATDCWESEKNKDKRPTNYRSKASEAAANVSEESKTKVMCSYCNKLGHIAEKCFAKQRDDKRKSNSSESGAVMLMAREEASECTLANYANTVDKNVFVADSGATSHMRKSLEGMYDLEDYRVGIRVGNNQVIHRRRGESLKALLSNKMVTPSQWSSHMCCMSQKFSLI